MDKEYFIAINSIFNEIPADGVEMFNKSPCVRLHDALIRDVTCSIVTYFFRVFGFVFGYFRCEDDFFHTNPDH